MTTSTGHPEDQHQQIQKLRDLIKDIEIGMLTTVDQDGSLRSRPMSTNGEVDSDGTLWFFVYASSHKIDEVDRHQQVNVSFAAPNKQRYVSVSGWAELVQDRNKVQELWKPELKAWFPQGLDEPDIALLKVNAEKAEYWDAPSSFVAHTIGLVKSITTGERAKVGENEKVQLK
jgi:general stress protein 26